MVSIDKVMQERRHVVQPQRRRSSIAMSAETSRDQPSAVLKAKMPMGFL
jgi:hypothetical protein